MRNVSCLTPSPRNPELLLMRHRLFAPDYQLRLEIGRHNDVQPDLNGRAAFASLEQYLGHVTKGTAAATKKHSKTLQEGNKKIAFFSATPRGGGVALMRHSLLRFFRLLGVDCTW